MTDSTHYCNELTMLTYTNSCLNIGDAVSKVGSCLKLFANIFDLGKIQK